MANDLKELILNWIRVEYNCRFGPERENYNALTDAEEEMRRAVTGETELFAAAQKMGLAPKDPPKKAPEQRYSEPGTTRPHNYTSSKTNVCDICGRGPTAHEREVPPVAPPLEKFEDPATKQPLFRQKVEDPPRERVRIRIPGDEGPKYTRSIFDLGK